MFLKMTKNPYQDGQPTRTVFYRPNISQIWAINAERLHKHPGLLNTIRPGSSLLLRSLDIMAGLIVLAGGVVSYTHVWWMFIPALIAAIGMRLANRKMAGTIARKAIARSNDNFLYLHSQQAIWLVTSQENRDDYKRAS